jgi:hypothetical protein
MTGEANRLKQWAAGGECDEQEWGGDFRSNKNEIYCRLTDVQALSLRFSPSSLLLSAQLKLQSE